MAYLLDTNVIINYLEASLPVAGMDFLNIIVDSEPTVSVITKMESLGFNFKSAQEQAVMETFFNASVILDINSDIVERTIALRRSKKIKLPDATIASTALVHGLVLVSRNTNDFKDIDGLKTIDPYNFDNK